MEDKTMRKKTSDPQPLIKKQDHLVTQESFRQNASFAEKILLNEGIFSRLSDEHDIKKLSRARIENMLNVNILQQTEASVNTKIGRKGINQWIWDNNVLTDIPTDTLKNYLYNRKGNDAYYFYKRYLLVRELTQKLSVYLKLPVQEILDEHLLNQEVWSHLSECFVTTNEKLSLIKSLYKKISKTSGYDNKQLHFVVNPRKKRKSKPIHPKAELYTEFLTKKGRSERTIKRYMEHINNMLSWLVNNIKGFSEYELNSIPILSIKEIHLQEFRSYLVLKQQKGEKSSSTISECIYAVKNFFSFLRKSYGFTDPASKLKSIKAPRYHFRELPTEEQLFTFFKSIGLYSDNPLMETIAFQLMLTLGFRSMEVSHVSWDNINMKTKTITIHSKGGKHHILPLTEKLYQNLEVYQGHLSTQKYLFGDNPSKIVRQLRENYKMYSHIADWNYPGGLHLFRHCFVTNLAGKNPPPQLMKELSRVVKLDTVCLYTHLNQRTNWLSQQINKLDYSPQGGK